MTSYILFNFSRLLNIDCLQKLSLKAFKMPYYAVASGRKQGVFLTWPECENQVKGFTGAKFKKFNTESEAKNFVMMNSQSGSSKKSNKTLTNKDFYRKSSTENKKKASKKPHEENDPRFEDMEDFQDELLSKMDSIEREMKVYESRVDGILNKGKALNKKAVVIEPIPQKNILKRNATDEVSVKRNKKLKYDFTVDNLGYVEVYTDGACSMNGYSGARAGLGVYFGDDHPLNVSEPVSGRATNNCGEIQAATKAIRLAHAAGVDKLCIKTDSNFVINSVTKWLPGWKRKDWKLSSGGPVKNVIDFKDLDKAIKLLEIKWEHVSAHVGIYGNECADKLAKLGATMYKKS